jgi:hypothetical protein
VPAGDVKERLLGRWLTQENEQNSQRRAMTNVYLPQTTPYQPQYQPQFQPAYIPQLQTQGPLGYSQTRGEKANEIATQIVPSALFLGLQGLEAAQIAGTAGTVSSIGAASSTVSGTAAAASTGAATTAAATSWLGTAASGMSVVGGIIGAMNIAMNWGKSTPAQGAASGTAVGAAIGTAIFPGPGTAIGAAVGLVVGGCLGAIRAGKHKDQIVRDRVRDVLVQNNVLDSNYGLTLADGSTYNMGRDGGKKSDLGGFRPYEVNFNNPLADYAVSWVNPLVDLMFPGNQKIKIDFSGYFANAALSNAKDLDGVRANIAAFMQRMGINDEQLAQAIIQRAQAGQIPGDVAQAFLNGINERLNPDFQLPTQTTQEPQATQELSAELSA